MYPYHWSGILLSFFFFQQLNAQSLSSYSNVQEHGNYTVVSKTGRGVDRVFKKKTSKTQIVFQNPTCANLTFVASNLRNQYVFLNTWDLGGIMIKSDSVYVNHFGEGKRTNWFEKEGVYVVNLSTTKLFYKQKIINVCPTN